MEHSKDIDHLNSFLRGELAAAETYEQAIDKVRRENPDIAVQLTRCKESHDRRAEALRREVRRLGGKPSASSGPWGSFVRLVEGGAKMFGTKAAIDVLEEGEDHGRNDYTRDLKDLDESERTFVEQQILPEQLETHRVMSRLQQTL